MYSQVEEYMAEFARQVSMLPLEQRESEIAEVRQHLESMAEAYQELGHSRADAVKLAIERFGAPKSIGRDLMRSTTPPDRRLIGQRLCLSASLLFLTSLPMPAITVFSVTLPGYACALIALAPNVPFSSFAGAAYLHLVGAANVLLLLSPLVQKKTKSRRARALMSLAMVSGCALSAPLYCTAGARIGVYVWGAAHIMAALGSVVCAAGDYDFYKVRQARQ